MIKLKLNNRRRIIIIASAALLLLLTLPPLSLRLIGQHRANQWSDSIAEAIQTYSSSPESDISTSLANLQSHLSDSPAPSPPKIFGLTLFTRAESQRLSTASAAAEAMSSQAQLAQESIQYQSKVAEILGKERPQSSSNLEESQALSDSWRAAVDELSSIAPPQQLQPYHTQLASHVTAIANDILALTELYKKQDKYGFEAKYEELTHKFSLLPELSAAYTAEAKQSDAQFQAKLEALEQTL